MSIKQSLIQQFLTAINKHSPSQLITLLALIGIETVIQHQNNPKMVSELTMIKNSIESIQQPTKFVEQTVKFEQPKRKERALTPKITEQKVPINSNIQRPHVQRHHLDDQAMKMALCQQYDFDTQETQPTTRQVSTRNEQCKNVKFEVPSPKQSIQYFIDAKSDRPFTPQSNEQHFKKERYNAKLKELQQGLTKEILLDYQTMLDDIKRNPQFYQASPEISLHEQQMNEIIKLSQHLEIPQQEHNEIFTSPTLQQEISARNSRKISQDDQQIRRELEQNQLQLDIQSINQPQDRVNPSTNIYEQNAFPQFFINDRISNAQLNVQERMVPQQQRKSESTFSFLPNRTKQTTQSSFQKSSPQGLMQMADKLINSPIIRQVTLKSGGDITPPSSRRSEQTKEIHVSNFDAQLSMTSNSSAFSLFQPNEELKSFFLKEIVKEDNEENNDPNSVMQSNIFIKGRIQCSKVF